MEIRDRFLLFLKAVKTTQREFGEKAGYRQQSLSKFITGTTKSPKIDLFVTLADLYPELNLRWLLLGKGEMFSKNIEPIPNELQEENSRLKEENSRLKDKIITLLEEK